MTTKTTTAREANGSRTDRTTHDALAELGARVLIAYRRECLFADGEINDSGEGAYRLKDAVAVAICSLGLLDNEEASQ